MQKGTTSSCCPSWCLPRRNCCSVPVDFCSMDFCSLVSRVLF